MQLPGNVLVSAVKSHTADNPSTPGGLVVVWLYQCQVTARLRLGVVFDTNEINLRKGYHVFRIIYIF